MHRRMLRFLLLCEGGSDTALVPHLRQLLSCCGAAEVVGTAWPLARVRDPGGAGASVLARKIRVVLAVEPGFEVVFIHRDADAAGLEARLDEIVSALREVELLDSGVAVVPVRMTEAWVLLDEESIRRVAGNPSGRQALNLPAPARIEDDLNPKRTLEEALVVASGHQGRRMRKFRKKFAAHRRILLEQLPVGHALNDVPAWSRLRQQVSDLVFRLNAGGPGRDVQ